MERRKALAWAGSISLAACVGALVLGSLAGGFGLWPPPAQETPASTARPEPGGATPRPLPEEGTGIGAEPGGAAAGPATVSPEAAPAPAGVAAGRASGRVPVIRRGARSPTADGKVVASSPRSSSSAETSVSGTSIPRRELGTPATPADGTSAVAPTPQPPGCAVEVKDPSPPSPFRQLPTTAGVAGLRATAGGQQRAAGTVVKIEISGTWSVQVTPSLPGRPPDGGTKTATGEDAAKGRSDNDG